MRGKTQPTNTFAKPPSAGWRRWANRRHMQTFLFERSSYDLKWDETFDVGSDTGTPVDDMDYQVPFTFNGKLNKLTLKLDRPQLTPEDIKKLQAAQKNNRPSE
jgi:hypothetical protein